MKRVLVLLGEHLLSAGLESLLAGENDLNVTSVTAAHENPFLEINEQNRPQIVIMDDHSQFASFSQIMRLLEIYPELRILVVNERENSIHIYDKVKIMVTHRADLITAIRGNYGSTC